MHSPRSHTSAVTAHFTALRRWLRPNTGPVRAGPGPGPTATHQSTTVVRSQATVPTDRGARYAKQLCSHAAWKTPRAQWTEPHGVIEFPDGAGTCRITAEADALVLAVEAAGPAELTRLQQTIASNIERFAAREGLIVRWVSA